MNTRTILFGAGIVILVVVAYWASTWDDTDTVTDTELATAEMSESDTTIEMESTESLDKRVTQEEYVVDEADLLGTNLIKELETTSLLSEAEIAGLLMMREEEKLARDVYNYLYDKWGLQIFSNIAASEETHTAAVGGLLELYDLEDPMTTDTPGVYVNQEMQALYDQLTTQGDISLTDALIVGATIEDLDIFDLEQLMSETTNESILTVYANLQKGSRNHLRAFNRQLTQRGETYTPQYMSMTEFESIVGAAQERGRVR